MIDEAQKAVDDRNRKRKRRGRAATMLTQTQAEPTTGAKTLLGQ